MYTLIDFIPMNMIHIKPYFKGSILFTATNWSIRMMKTVSWLQYEDLFFIINKYFYKTVTYNKLLMFVCLFLEFIVPLDVYVDVTIAGEGLQILNNARHSWPLSSEGSLACHTYCVTGYPFIMVIPETFILFLQHLKIRFFKPDNRS